MIRPTPRSPIPTSSRRSMPAGEPVRPGRAIRHALRIIDDMGSIRAGRRDTGRGQGRPGRGAGQRRAVRRSRARGRERRCRALAPVQLPRPSRHRPARHQRGPRARLHRSLPRGTPAARAGRRAGPGHQRDRRLDLVGDEPRRGRPRHRPGPRGDPALRQWPDAADLAKDAAFVWAHVGVAQGHLLLGQCARPRRRWTSPTGRRQPGGDLVATRERTARVARRLPRRPRSPLGQIRADHPPDGGRDPHLRGGPAARPRPPGRTARGRRPVGGPRRPGRRTAWWPTRSTTHVRSSTRRRRPTAAVVDASRTSTCCVGGRGCRRAGRPAPGAAESRRGHGVATIGRARRARRGSAPPASPGAKASSR